MENTERAPELAESATGMPGLHIFFPDSDLPPSQARTGQDVHLSDVKWAPLKTQSATAPSYDELCLDDSQRLPAVRSRVREEVAFDPRIEVAMALHRRFLQKKAMEQEMRQREAMEQEMRQREAMEQEMRQREAREQEMRQREAREQAMRQREAREQETPVPDSGRFIIKGTMKRVFAIPILIAAFLLMWYVLGPGKSSKTGANKSAV